MGDDQPEAPDVRRDIRLGNVAVLRDDVNSCLGMGSALPAGLVTGFSRAF